MKKNASGSGTIRRRSDGRWEGRAFLGYDPATGKPIRKSVYGKTQDEARKKLNAVTNAVDNKTYKEPSKLLLSEWLDIWIAEYTAHLKPRTIVEYASTIRYNIVPRLGRIKLCAITETAIQAFVNALTRSGLAPKTVKNIHGVLHSALAEALRIGYITHNPASGTKLPRTKRTELTVLTYEELARLIDAFQSDKYGSVYLAYLLTGLRRSELLGLTWDCVDFTNARIRVFKQYQRIKGVHSFQTLKNDKERAIAASFDLLNILRMVRIKQSEHRLKAGTAWQNKAGFVFTNEIGKPLSDSTIYNHYKRLVARLGFPALRLHDLRHAYAINSLQAGDNVKTVQEHLGHYSAAFTLDIYARATKDMQDQSAANMQAFMNFVKTQKK